jgi:3',5'-cyclic AMP phosphodiesterase CpdA
MATLLHLSDVHFGPPHRRDASDAVLRLAESLAPDLVVISGDLTQRAKPAQFREARAWIDRFTVPTLAVPGNHDVPMYRVWERLLAPWKAWRDHYGGPLESVHRSERVWAFGINTAQAFTVKQGRVRRRSIQTVATLAADAPAGALRVLVAHHPWVPPPRFGDQRVATGAEYGVEMAFAAGIEVVLSGHEHRAWVAGSEDYWGRPGITFVQSGTSTSSRGRGPERGVCSAHRIEARAGSVEVTQLVFDAPTAKFEEGRVWRLPRRAV